MFNKLLYKLCLIEAKEKIDMERGAVPIHGHVGALLNICPPNS